jgi:hypothetical protein
MKTADSRALQSATQRQQMAWQSRRASQASEPHGRMGTSAADQNLKRIFNTSKWENWLLMKSIILLLCTLGANGADSKNAYPSKFACGSLINSGNFYSESGIHTIIVNIDLDINKIFEQAHIKTFGTQKSQDEERVCGEKLLGITRHSFETFDDRIGRLIAGLVEAGIKTNKRARRKNSKNVDRKQRSNFGGRKARETKGKVLNCKNCTQVILSRNKRPVTMLALIISCFLSVGASTLFSSLVSTQQLNQLSGAVESNYLAVTQVVSATSTVQGNIRTIYEKGQVVGHSVQQYGKILEIMLNQANCRQLEIKDFYIKIFIMTKLQNIYSALVRREISHEMLSDESIRHIVQVDPSLHNSGYRNYPEMIVTNGKVYPLGYSGKQLKLLMILPMVPLHRDLVKLEVLVLPYYVQKENVIQEVTLRNEIKDAILVHNFQGFQIHMFLDHQIDSAIDFMHCAMSQTDVCSGQRSINALQKFCLKSLFIQLDDDFERDCTYVRELLVTPRILVQESLLGNLIWSYGKVLAINHDGSRNFVKLSENKPECIFLTNRYKEVVITSGNKTKKLLGRFAVRLLLQFSDKQLLDSSFFHMGENKSILAKLQLVRDRLSLNDSLHDKIREMKKVQRPLGINPLHILASQGVSWTIIAIITIVIILVVIKLRSRVRNQESGFTNMVMSMTRPERRQGQAAETSSSL